MNWLSLLPQLLPLLPRIEKAVATYEKIAADPDVQDAIAVVEEVAKIVAVPSEAKP